MEMEIAVNKTLSLDLECLKILIELKKETDINKSKLVRMFIKYFNNNKDKLAELIKGEPT